MIQARTGSTLILGLSARNIEKLMQSLPILFDASFLGPEFNGINISIVYGRTEQDIVAQLQDMGLGMKPV